MWISFHSPSHSLLSLLSLHFPAQCTLPLSFSFPFILCHFLLLPFHLFLIYPVHSNHPPPFYDTIPPQPSPPYSSFSLWPQQQQLQHLSHHAPGIPLTPHPSGLSLGAGSSGLLALTGALGVSAHLASKDERNHLDPEHLRGKELWTFDP